MDAQLAAIYGTGQNNAEDDLEKVAAAELLVKLAAENNIDLNSLSDAQIGELVQELYKTAESAPPPPAKESKESAESAEEKSKKEAQEKVAEADFLGRVMAHSMVQELNEIQKEAGGKLDAIKGGGKKALDWVKGRPGAWSEAKRKATEAATGKGSLGTGAMSKMDRLRALGSAAKTVAPELAAGTMAVGGGAYGAKKLFGKKKEEKTEEKAASANEELLNQAAAERALQMAKEAGWVDAEGNLIAPPAQEEEKQAAAELEQAVTLRALQMLEANGYPVQWNE